MLSLLSTLAVLVGASAVAAQNTDIQTPPFNLILLSSNSTINGSSLVACHEGAAIEGLCVGSKLTAANASYSTYNFNYSSALYNPNYTQGIVGELTYTLRGSNFNESEPMQLLPNVISNVALALFQPSYSATQVAFDDHDLLNIQSSLDDTTVPATTNVTKAYYRWYACQTNSEYHRNLNLWPFTNLLRSGIHLPGPYLGLWQRQA